MLRGAPPDALSHSRRTEFLCFPERSVSIGVGCQVLVCTLALGVPGEWTLPDTVSRNRVKGLSKFSRVALEELY